MTDRWASDMVEAIRGKKDSASSFGSGLMFATVNTAKPLTLKMHNQVISQGIFINPALLVDADDAVDKIEQDFVGAPAPTKLFDFLKQYHKQCVIKKGDELIVLQSGVSFYVLAKVAAI